MDKRTKLLISLFVFLLAFSVGFSFFNTVIVQDFEIVDSSEDNLDE